MTGMLASVADAEEAEMALAGGADIIDLKDPRKGALGALAVDEVRRIAARIAGRKQVSAVTGDLPMDPPAVTHAAETMASTGVDFVKVGLFPDDRRLDCIKALSGAAKRTKLIGVMFADRKADPSLLPALREAGFAGAMVDTAGKGQGRLLDHMNAAEIARFVAACRREEMICGLAGSLEAPDVPRLLAHDPDYLGFRGALCDRLDRKAGLDAKAFAAIRALIPRETPGADLSILAARGYARDDEEADRVHVRELVLPVVIGAYASEHDRPQRVRFDIAVDVRRQPQRPDDMSQVFSYDLVIDGINALVAQGHITLVETLAERIAQMLLRHPDVVATTVKVEKLDLGAAIAGVEITRRRAAEAAGVHRLFAASLDPRP